MRGRADNTYCGHSTRDAGRPGANRRLSGWGNGLRRKTMWTAFREDKGRHGVMHWTGVQGSWS